LLNPVCQKGGSPALPPDDLEGIDSYILQLHEHDSDGQAFRYATRKLQGQWLPSLPAGLKHINIRDFANALEKLADYLEGLDNWFGDLVEAKVNFRATSTTR
jgi:hypothetical protein